MGLGPIQFGGLASGLDTTAIISAILQLEARPIRLLESQKSTEQNKLSLIGTLEGLVSTLQEKARDLAGGEFYAHALTVGNEGVASFTLSSGAASGSHTLDVQSLAQADRYSYDGVADADATGLGTGTITFDYDGTSYSVDVAAGFDSLNGIADSINNADAGDVVTASVINVGTGSSPSYQLVLTGDDTGADYTIDNLSVGTVGLTGQTNITAARNASVILDGLAVERSSNVFSDVLAGVSFTVSAVDQTSFTVDSDPEGIKENLQSFLDAYNDVIGFINKQSEYDPEGGTGGDLFGDSALRSIRQAMNSALFNVDLATVTADTEGFSTLGLIGIDLADDGTLSIDDATFDEKLSENLDAVANLLIQDDGEGTGLLVNLDDALDALLKSSTNEIGTQYEGLLKNRRTSIDGVIDSIDDRIERLELNLERLEETLVQRFANLEQIVGGLNSQGAFLASSLAFPSNGN